MNSEKWLMVKSTVAQRGHAIHFLISIYRAIFCYGNCTEWSTICIGNHMISSAIWNK